MLSAALFTMLLSAANPPMMIPEGTVLPVILNETLNTAKLQANDPILLSLGEDVRSGGNRGPILIPRGSNVVGRVVKSDRAGHFIGRAHLDIRVQEIITPTGIVYDGLSSKVVDVGKNKGEKGQVNASGEIQGPVHRERDTVLLLFPPTTLFQLMAIPRRGPDVVLPVETRLYVKLMSPIYAENAVAVGAATPAPAATLYSQVMPNELPQPVPQPVPQLLPQGIPQAQARPRLSSINIEVLVTPIALYPDTILHDLLVACTHPLQIVQANQWLQQGRAGYAPTWDSSVWAITAYPELLQRLSGDIAWARNLGSAFSSQPNEVMGAVQRMRTLAYRR